MRIIYRAGETYAQAQKIEADCVSDAGIFVSTDGSPRLFYHDLHGMDYSMGIGEAKAKIEYAKSKQWRSPKLGDMWICFMERAVAIMTRLERDRKIDHLLGGDEHETMMVC